MKRLETDKRPIPGFEGRYEMDGNGDVWSIARSYRNSLGRTCQVKAKKLKPIKHGTGYVVVGLEGKTYRLHRLVAIVWHPNPDNKEYVNHIDANKHNYHPSNLEWATHMENTIHAMDNDLTARGERNGGAKLTDAQCRELFDKAFEGYSLGTLAELYGIDRNTVTKAIYRLGEAEKAIWKQEAKRRKSKFVFQQLM